MTHAKVQWCKMTILFRSACGSGRQQGAVGMVCVYSMMPRASAGMTQMAAVGARGGDDLWGLESSGSSSLTYLVPGLEWLWLSSVANVVPNVASRVLGFLIAWWPQVGQWWLRDPRTSVSANKMRAIWHSVTSIVLYRSKQSQSCPDSIGEYGRTCGHVLKLPLFSSWASLSCPVSSCQDFDSSLNPFVLTYLYMHLLHSSSDIILFSLFPKAMGKRSPGLYDLGWPQVDLC